MYLYVGITKKKVFILRGKMRSPARVPDMHICYLVHRPTKCLVKRVSDCILLLVCGINITKCIAKHISICTCLFLCRAMCDLVHKRLYMVVYVAYMSVRWFRIALISTASLSFGVCWVQYVATLSQHKAIGVIVFMYEGFLSYA